MFPYWTLSADASLIRLLFAFWSHSCSTQLSESMTWQREWEVKCLRGIKKPEDSLAIAVQSMEKHILFRYLANIFFVNSMANLCHFMEQRVIHGLTSSEFEGIPKICHAKPGVLADFHAHPDLWNFHGVHMPIRIFEIWQPIAVKIEWLYLWRTTGGSGVPPWISRHGELASPGTVPRGGSRSKFGWLYNVFGVVRKTCNIKWKESKKVFEGSARPLLLILALWAALPLTVSDFRTNNL